MAVSRRIQGTCNHALIGIVKSCLAECNGFRPPEPLAVCNAAQRATNPPILRPGPQTGSESHSRPPAAAALGLHRPSLSRQRDLHRRGLQVDGVRFDPNALASLAFALSTVVTVVSAGYAEIYRKRFGAHLPLCAGGVRPPARDRRRPCDQRHAARRSPSLYILVIATASLLVPAGGGLLIAALGVVLYFSDVVLFFRPSLAEPGVWIQLGIIALVALGIRYLSVRLRESGEGRDLLVTALAAVAAAGRRHPPQHSQRRRHGERRRPAALRQSDGGAPARPRAHRRASASRSSTRSAPSAPELADAVKRAAESKIRTTRGEGFVSTVAKRFPVGVTTTYHGARRHRRRPHRDGDLSGHLGSEADGGAPAARRAARGHRRAERIAGARDQESAGVDSKRGRADLANAGRIRRSEDAQRARHARVGPVVAAAVGISRLRARSRRANGASRSRQPSRAAPPASRRRIPTATRSVRVSCVAPGSGVVAARGRRGSAPPRGVQPRAQRRSGVAAAQRGADRSGARQLRSASGRRVLSRRCRSRCASPTAVPGIPHEDPRPDVRSVLHDQGRTAAASGSPSSIARSRRIAGSCSSTAGRKRHALHRHICPARRHQIRSIT